MHSRFCRLVILLLTLSMVSLFSQGSALAEAEQETLWVVTEQSTSGDMNLQTQLLIAKFPELYPDVTVRLDILPCQKEERTAYLSSLREKMSAGEGPDVFLLPTDVVLTLDYPQKFTYQKIEPLFPDVQQAMQDGVFADISAYYESDTSLEKSALNETIMDAGTAGSARFVLPLRFNTRVIYVFNELLEDAGISNEVLNGTAYTVMQEAVQSGNPDLISCTGIAVASVFSNFVRGSLSEADAEEVADYMRCYQSLRTLVGEGSGIDGRFDYLSVAGNRQTLQPAYYGVLSDALSALATAEEFDLTLSVYPVRTAEGETVASVSYYGAVGSSCGNPELAYTFLRQFLQEDAQWEQERNSENVEWSFSPIGSGWPVRTAGSAPALWENICGELLKGKVSASDISLPILSEKMDLAWFPIQSDFSKYLAQLNDSENGNAPLDVDIDALAAEFIESTHQADAD